MTLDVRVWEPSVMGYFQAVGNTYANTIWEELLSSDSIGLEELGERCVCNHMDHFNIVSNILHIYEISGH